MFPRREESSLSYSAEVVVMNEKPTRVVLTRVLSASVVAVLVFAALYWTLASVVVKRQAEVLYKEKLRAGEMAVGHFATASVAPLLEDDTLGLNVLLRQIKFVPGLRYACITDKEGIIKAHTDPTKIGGKFQDISRTGEPVVDGDMEYASGVTSEGERVLAISSPVVFMKETLARVHVRLSLAIIEGAIRKERAALVRSFVTMGIIMLAVLVCSFFVVSVFWRRGRVSPSSSLPLTSNNKGPAEGMEPDEADGSSGTTAEGIESLTTCGDQMKRNQVSVLFIGIKGFRAYAEKRDPELLQEDLNQYLSITARVIEENGGHLDRLVGDAVISVFGSSLMASDHANRAVKAATDMQDAFRESGDSGNGLLSRVGIGISSGVVLSGCVGAGPNKELTFIGESFRTAYSLNVLAAAGEIIVSKDAYQLLEGHISVEPLPPREILQRTKSWESFRLLRRVHE
jgi:adenylate cyclase